MGLRGSQAFCDHFGDLYPQRAGWLMFTAKPKKKEAGNDPHAAAAEEQLYPAIMACMNMDMIGRLRGAVGAAGHRLITLLGWCDRATQRRDRPIAIAAERLQLAN